MGSQHSGQLFPQLYSGSYELVLYFDSASVELCGVGKGLGPLLSLQNYTIDTLLYGY